MRFLLEIIGYPVLIKHEQKGEIKRNNVELYARMRVNIHLLGFRLCFDTLFYFV